MPGWTRFPTQSGNPRTDGVLGVGERQCCQIRPDFPTQSGNPRTDGVLGVGVRGRVALAAAVLWLHLVAPGWSTAAARVARLDGKSGPIWQHW